MIFKTLAILFTQKHTHTQIYIHTYTYIYKKYIHTRARFPQNRKNAPEFVHLAEYLAPNYMHFFLCRCTHRERKRFPFPFKVNR